jgi:hypothetical protein
MCGLAAVGDDEDGNTDVITMTGGGEQHREADGAEKADLREVDHDLPRPAHGCRLPQRLMQQRGGGEINLADRVHDDLVADLLATYLQQRAAHL